ncbi:hypothetical protein E2562_009123 [Oryza meyeriana var. granulata]|uniref:Uncharacterized protein n=1 Tax=Oryza meyeriana var. granulata TaxID=110450 RepID=A0A6G1D327_9ORYZ|nr:hypothetical protein E2562_009123 [Oryza meyeriana var. granulata]
MATAEGKDEEMAAMAMAMAEGERITEDVHGLVSHVFGRGLTDGECRAGNGGPEHGWLATMGEDRNGCSGVGGLGSQSCADEVDLHGGPTSQWPHGPMDRSYGGMEHAGPTWKRHS